MREPGLRNAGWLLRPFASRLERLCMDYIRSGMMLRIYSYIVSQQPSRLQRLFVHAVAIEPFTLLQINMEVEKYPSEDY